MSASARRFRQFRSHFLVLGALAVLLTVGLWLALGRQNFWPWWLASWLLATNLLAVGYYGYDKARARAGERRIPEVVLHTLAALGGSLGAYLGMRLFRHKTIKGKFRILFWCIVTLQVLLVLVVVRHLWWR